MSKRSKKNKSDNIGSDLIESSKESVPKAENALAVLYFLIMMFIYPFFIRNGYYRIGEVKYIFFRSAGIVFILSVIAAVSLRRRQQKNYFPIRAFYKDLSLTDGFVYCYMASVLLSYIFTPYHREAFWGAEGWYMGFVSQFLLVGIYLIFSRYFMWKDKWLYAILMSSEIVFLLGILNRYSVYPIRMSGYAPGFISTLGNINWFCGYWAVLCPLGIVFYWKSKAGAQQAIAGIYVVTGIIIGIVQGSSSAYLVFAGMFVYLFGISFDENRSMYRFLQLCLLFLSACQIARAMRYIPNFSMNYENPLSTFLTKSNASIYIAVVVVLLYALFYYGDRQKGFDVSKSKNIRNIVIGVVPVIIAVYAILLILNSSIDGGIPGLAGVSALTFNDEWASCRGATWSIGAGAYISMPLPYKLIGAGPDCFAPYIYSQPDLAARAYARFGNSMLTNAHNEWLTVLVNNGLAGLISYAGIFISAFIGFMKKAVRKPDLYLFAACILLYTIHNIVSFQQVLNAPFAFMLLGIGEGIRRDHIEY